MTTATTQFIEDAIKGGWQPIDRENHGRRGNVYVDDLTRWVNSDVILLDPLAWQAVGKVRGWVQSDFEVCFGCGVRITKKIQKVDGKHYSCKSDIEWWPSQAAFEQVLFMKRLAIDGKTIEDALTSIE